MANRLTGDYGAALQLSPTGTNVVLALIHRKGDPRPGSSGHHLLHGGTLDLPIAGAPAGDLALRGSLDFQLSTPTVRVPNDTDGRRLTVAVQVRARFRRAPGTPESAPAPEFVHGELNLTSGIDLTRCGPETLVDANLRDAEVGFVPAPGSGATPADVAVVRQVAAELLRRAVAPVQVRVSGLGEGDLAVRRLDVRTLRGGESAISVLLQLADGPAPDPASATAVFVERGDDLAFALGRELVSVALPERARDDLAGLSVSASRFFLSVTATVDESTLAFELRDGVVVASVEGAGRASIVGSFGFRVTQRLGLGIRSGAPSFSLVGDPELEITRGGLLTRGLLALLRSSITGRLRSAIQDGLRDVGRELGALIDANAGALLGRLGVGARFVLGRIDVSPDGIVFAGNVAAGPPPPVFASFTSGVRRPPGADPTSLDLHHELDARASWIPGGTVQSHHWTEVRGDGSVRRRVDDPHRFVLRRRHDEIATTTSELFAWPPTTWCLEVRGTQHVATGSAPLPVSGRVCGATTLVPGLDLDRSLRLAVRVPDGNGGVRADVDPWGGYRAHAFAGEEEARGFLLVHHAPAGRTADAARALREAAEAAAPRVLAFPLLVVGDGACGGRLPAAELATVAYTHDPEGCWRSRLRLEEPGTTVLLGPGGREVFRESGPPCADALASALQEHAGGWGRGDRAPRLPRTSRVTAAVSVGELAPDFAFPCAPDELAPLFLRKLRGRERVVCFWTSWSEPSLEEVRRLASRCGEGRGAPFVVLVNDGEPAARAADALRELGVAVHAVCDEERSIARRYGVSAWPTVIRVDAEGRVAEVRVGLDPEGRGDEGREQG